MRGLLALAACAALCGCKEKQEQQSGNQPASATTPSAKGPAPALPGETTASATSGANAPAEKVPVKPISVQDAAAALPTIEGREVIALKQTSDRSQVHGTWCVDGTSADDVAKKIGHTLAQGKYANITIRGDARKAGVGADRDGIRVSVVVSASSASVCQAPARYFTSATVFRL